MKSEATAIVRRYLNDAPFHQAVDLCAHEAVDVDDGVPLDAEQKQRAYDTARWAILLWECSKSVRT